MTGCENYPNSSDQIQTRIEESAQYLNGKFRNKKTTKVFDIRKTWATIKDYRNKPNDTEPGKPLPVLPLTITAFDLSDQAALRFSRLGHSTLLLQMSGKLWLTDPVFSQRVSPVQWAGPKRFQQPPISIEELPTIEGVVISHNHYDHLDHDSILKLKDKVKHFVVPLGVGNKLIDWGVAAEKITELDWWENVYIGDVEFISTPAQHFSGRGILDGDKTLWSSWVIRNKQQSVYYSGDTGYFPGFKDIGEKYGPFDFAFMECGAYNKLWSDIHMMPEDSLQAFKDLKGKVLVPVHNGTFDLSTHSWFDPMEKITALAKESQIILLTPQVGEVVDIKKIEVSKPWWRSHIVD